jgi:hypothetical protein
LVRSGSTESGIKGKVPNFVALGQTRLDVTAALPLGFGARTSPSLLAGQPVKLGIKTAGCKFLAAGDLLTPFPPLTILRSFGCRLGTGFLLGNLGAFRDIFILA